MPKEMHRNRQLNSGESIAPPVSPLSRPPDFYRSYASFLLQIRYWTPTLWHFTCLGDWRAEHIVDIPRFWREARKEFGTPDEAVVHCMLDLKTLRKLGHALPFELILESGPVHFWPIARWPHSTVGLGQFKAHSSVVRHWQAAFVRAGRASGYAASNIRPSASVPSRIDFEIDRLGRFIDNADVGSLAPVDLVEGFKPLYNAAQKRNVQWANLQERMQNIEKHWEYSNRAHRLRADIWKLATNKALSTEALIQNLLDRIGPFLKVSRACYNSYIDDAHQGGVVCTTEWCASDVKPSMGTHIPQFLVKTFENKDFFHITPESASKMVPKPIQGIVIRMIEAITRPLEIVSLSVLPHRVESSIEGWFTFDICHGNPHHLEMTPEVRDVVNEMVDIINNHILQKRVQAALKSAYDDLEQRVAARTADLARSNSDLAREIDERKQTEQLLRKAKEVAESANRAKSQFLANVSHEVRTPLHAIIGFSEMTLRSWDIHTIHEKTKIVLKESDALLHLFEDLLDQARIEAGKMSLKEEPFHFESMLEQLKNNFVAEANRKALQYDVEVIKTVPEWLTGDELRLRQVLNNLLQNAIKFTGTGGVVLRVIAEAVTRKTVALRFEVEDSGIGIPEDKQTEIFESFTQADGSMTRLYGGTGLGTTIARQIIQLMDGEIGVKSEEGVGSLFWCTVVFQRPTQREIEEAKSLVSSQKSRVKPGHWRILLVEDYPANQEVALMCLEDAGCHVHVAANGLEAVEAADRDQYDLILMDVQMPLMDGHTAARQIRQPGNKNRQTPIVGVTAHAGIEDRLACLDSGMDDVLTKPLHHDLLLEAVGRWAGETPMEAEPARHHATKQTPLDIVLLNEEFGPDNDWHMTVRRFLETARAQVIVMRSAHEAEDGERLWREAHALKGGSATLTAELLRQSAERLEKAAKAGREELAVLIDDVELKLQDLTAFMAQ